MTLETDKETTISWPSPWEDDDYSEKLPFVLAGPILRRLESDRIFIWLATSKEHDLNIRVYEKNLESKYELCFETNKEDVTAQSLGTNLIVYLFEINGSGGKLEVDTVYYYDLCDSTKTSVFGEEELDAITYKGEKYPSFVLPSKITSLLHASCRKLHAPCSDAMVRADELIQEKISDSIRRPAVMCMTGDQIYADDVAGPLFFRIRALSKLIIGDRKNIKIPRLSGPDLHSLPVYGRAGAIYKASLTSRHGHNHVATFGEFAALYLLTLNPNLWGDLPEKLPESHLEAFTHLKTLTQHKQYLNFNPTKLFIKERRSLINAKEETQVFRRLLANIACFMVFDDHEFTDDWNVNGAWHDAVHHNSAGKKIIANAISSFWAFQGWGNDPDQYNDNLYKSKDHGKDFRDAISYLAPVKSNFNGILPNTPPKSDSVYIKQMWKPKDWGFAVPTNPVIAALDTRTSRHFDSQYTPPRLMDSDALERFKERCTKAGVGQGKNTDLIIISPPPVYGYNVLETLQAYASKKFGIAGAVTDYEGWSGNIDGLADLLITVNEQLQPPLCLILSGDVHYAFTKSAQFCSSGRQQRIVQLVSSSARNFSAWKGVFMMIVGVLSALLSYFRGIIAWLRRRKQCLVAWCPDYSPSYHEACGYEDFRKRIERTQDPKLTYKHKFWFSHVKHWSILGICDVVTVPNIGHVEIDKNKTVTHTLLCTKPLRYSPFKYFLRISVSFKS